ncbi:MAG TPA: PEP-CTERM sorting domain-containing protein [Acidobacteriaceae bacterium]|jgi:hypothetical protein|nr:PEP-CTERM sorting domain-containing protein [Acidobacteriaceae bacterium]
MRNSVWTIRALTLLVAFGAIGLAAKADSSLYTDGATNGTNGALTINSGWQVEDSFALSSASTLNSVTFGNWFDPGDTGLTVDWAIVSSEGSQTPVCGSCSGTASLSGVFDFTNVYSYDIYDETFSLPSLNLAAGTYWLSLQNETTSFGSLAYWDNSGGLSGVYQQYAGDGSPGDLGGDNCTAIYGYPAGGCSNAFTIYGTSSTGVTPEPSSLALLVSGITLLGAEIRRRRLI